MTSIRSLQEAAAARGQTDDDWPGLQALVDAREELGARTLEQGYRSLVLLGRKALPILLAADRLASLGTLEEATAKLAAEGAAKAAERDGLAAEVVKLRAAGTDLRSRNDELTTRVADMTARCEELERAERGLAVSTARYEAMARDHDELRAEFNELQQIVTDLRAEQDRLQPIIASGQKIERDISERQQVLDGINAAIVELRSRIG
jgi:uncharacterized coiled-coil DUF342 family protein